MHMAAWHGCSVPVFGRILNKIKDVNAGNNQNRTAITIALAEKHLDLVESLLKVEDIDVNISDNVTGKNALHWASTRLCSPYLYKQILDKINNGSPIPLPFSFFSSTVVCTSSLRKAWISTPYIIIPLMSSINLLSQLLIYKRSKQKWHLIVHKLVMKDHRIVV